MSTRNAISRKDFLHGIFRSVAKHGESSAPQQENGDGMTPEPDYLSMLPPELRPAYAPWLREDYDPSLHALVKAADKLSAHIKCVEEVKAGNNEFRQAAGQTLEAVKAMDLPEVDYFIEHFLPAFGLTLDELQ